MYRFRTGNDRFRYIDGMGGAVLDRQAIQPATSTITWVRLAPPRSTILLSELTAQATVLATFWLGPSQLTDEFPGHGMPDWNAAT